MLVMSEGLFGSESRPERDKLREVALYAMAPKALTSILLDSSVASLTQNEYHKDF
jgi:hypothetical protein